MHTSLLFPLMCEGRLQGVCSNGAEVFIRLPVGAGLSAADRREGIAHPDPDPPTPTPTTTTTKNHRPLPPLSYKNWDERYTQHLTQCFFFLCDYVGIMFWSDIKKKKHVYLHQKLVSFFWCFIYFLSQPGNIFGIANTCFSILVLVRHTFQLWNMLSFYIYVKPICHYGI